MSEDVKVPSGSSQRKKRSQPSAVEDVSVPADEVVAASLPESACDIPLKEFNDALTADWVDRKRGGRKSTKSRNFGTVKNAKSVVSKEQRNALVRTCQFLLLRMWPRSSIINACVAYLHVRETFVVEIVDEAHGLIALDSGVSSAQAKLVVQKTLGSILRNPQSTNPELLQAIKQVSSLYGIGSQRADSGGSSSGDEDYEYLRSLISEAHSSESVDAVARLRQVVEDEIKKRTEKSVRGR